MNQTYSQAVEDYLKTIYQLQHRDDQAVATNTLAERLGVAPASVTNMIKKLADQNLVQYEPYQGVNLTNAGREIALRVIRNHRLVELYLVEVLGVPWDQVHAQAENWEHSLSDHLAERMNDVLGNPANDPHGAPIPTSDGDIIYPDQIRLANLKSGQTALVSEVSDHSAELLRYLNDLGLYPGQMITVSRITPFDGSLIISINDTEHAVGLEVARHVFVTDPCWSHKK